MSWPAILLCMLALLKKAPADVNRRMRTVAVSAWILGFICYGRGGQPLRVLVAKLQMAVALPTMPNHLPWWSLLLSPREAGVPARNGQFDAITSIGLTHRESQWVAEPCLPAPRALLSAKQAQQPQNAPQCAVKIVCKNVRMMRKGRALSSSGPTKRQES